MKRISIVGVEGSGKSVLMAVLGAKFMRPNRCGLFLQSVDRDTFMHCNGLCAEMCRGEWPGPTLTGALLNLRWNLMRSRTPNPDELAELHFLDFAGEDYRSAFNGEKDVKESSAEAVAALRNHVSESDMLFVLMNINDVIVDANDPVAVQRRHDIMWLTQAMLGYARRTDVVDKECVIVFTNADRWQALLGAHGGPQGVFQQFLPNVAALYPGIPVLAVSAVNDTSIHVDGRIVPAANFSSTGLDELIEWIAGIGESSQQSSNPVSRNIDKVKCERIPAQMFSGAPVHPECRLFDEELSYALVKGKDYIIKYDDVDAPGMATIIIEGIGAYSGSKEIKFMIKKSKDLRDIKDCILKLNKERDVYYGFVGVKPDYILMCGLEQLRKGFDYKEIVLPMDLRNKGEIRIQGVGRYYGEMLLHYEIKKRAFFARWCGFWLKHEFLGYLVACGYMIGIINVPGFLVWGFGSDIEHIEGIFLFLFGFLCVPIVITVGGMFLCNTEDEIRFRLRGDEKNERL